jgi:L-alanine-DL-glutamate epimerase-like enolase superfamily enzyme
MAYRVTQETLTGCGHETSAMQQWQQLQNMGIEQPKPRQQILDDLTDFAAPYEAAGHEVIIMIDANSPIEDTALETFMNALNLYDLMAEYLPDTPPSTYQ